MVTNLITIFLSDNLYCTQNFNMITSKGKIVSMMLFSLISFSKMMHSYIALTFLIKI